MFTSCCLVAVFPRRRKEFSLQCPDRPLILPNLLAKRQMGGWFLHLSKSPYREADHYLHFMIILRIHGAFLSSLMPVPGVTISTEISIVYLVYTLCLTRRNNCVDNIDVCNDFISLCDWFWNWATFYACPMWNFQVSFLVLFSVVS